MSAGSEREQIRDTAIQLALEAGSLLRDRVGRHQEVVFKGEIDLVTEVDRGAELLIADGLAAAHPTHALLGEEGTTTGVDVKDAEWVWIVDPIDGTTNFTHAYPHFAVSIAVVRDGIGEIGVVYDPSRDELFCGVRDQGATLNGRPVAVSRVDTLKRSLLGTGFSYDESLRAEQHDVWAYLHSRCQGIRREGSAALGVAWLSVGRIDGFYEKPINAWDVGAGAIIGAAAGATVTALDGGPYDVFGQELLISNGLIHDELTEAIAIGTSRQASTS